MTFIFTDFDSMRKWLYSITGPFSIRRARVSMFDSYRYKEDYESLYNFITEMGGEIKEG